MPFPPGVPSLDPPLPPLPDPIPDPEPILPEPFPPEWRERFEIDPIRFRFLRGGCYLIRYTPTTHFRSFVHYDGTMRVQRDGRNTIASGDLYLHRWLFWPHRLQPTVTVAEPAPAGPIPIPGERPLIAANVRLPWWFREPNPANGIPIFARSRYRYYLRVTQILEWFTTGNSFTLGFERHRFDQASNSWTNEGAFTARMTWVPAPVGYPNSSDYLTGDVKNSLGTIVGKLTMGWVSPFLRRAVIEIDRVPQSEEPDENGAGVDWQDVYDQVSWDVAIDVSDTNLAEPSGAGWSDSEMHAEMLARRDASNLDAEWRYHLICVRQLDSTSRGIMYDAYGGDSNNIPREGAGISSHWMIPNTATWGLVRGLRFGTADAPYFRTAVHELGHAMGLYHNTVDNGFMNTTGVIAGSATPGTFPTNVQWSFAADDAKRLRHMPDPWVRPGMIPFGQSYSTTPISPDDEIETADGLELRVSALLAAVPVGAPVRVTIELENTSDEPLPVPPSLSLKSGNVAGRVIDASGTGRVYWPLVRCIDEEPIGLLAPGDSISHSLTLLRGPDGALFSSAGTYRVIVDVTWHIEGHPVRVSGEAAVMVTPPVDEEHAQAAIAVLSEPDALLTLALGGDHLDKGIEAINVALDNPVLRPHYAYIEAKRIGKRFGKRKADLQAACELLDDDTVMSAVEVTKTAEFLPQKKQKELRDDPSIKKAIKTLKKRAKQLQEDDAAALMKKL